MALAPRVVLFSRSLDNVCGTITFVRYSKHYDPKFKWLRKMKYIKPPINFDKKFTDQEKIDSLRERGIVPRRKSDELPIYIDSSVQIFDPYVPQEGDGQYTNLSTRITSALNIKDSALRKGKNLLALRKIRKFIANFDEEQFALTALDIYIKAHNALASNNMDELTKYATDNAICLMCINAKNKTIRWKYIESLDPPKTVHIRYGCVGTEENLFAQITVRFHSKQVLAVYDRFGRLIYGSEILAKDVLEFGVFEIHLTNINGTYRLHHKIIPDWLEPRFSIKRTFVKPEEVQEIEDDLGDEYKLVSETLENEEKEEKELKQ